MAIKASEIIQTVILLDQVTAAVLRLIREAKTVDGADEEQLKAQLAALRKRNDERFAEVEQLLKDRAAGN